MNTILKRDRLIEAAKLMFYQQGVIGTTLADIAQQAQVPLGNIYYHFRTKEALVEAVIQAHLQELQSLFARLDHLPDPRQRLLGLLLWESVSRTQQRGRPACYHCGSPASGLPGLGRNAVSPARQGRTGGEGFRPGSDLVVAGHVLIDQ